MDRFLRSKFFVVLAPIINLVLFIVAGVMLSYVPNVSGMTSGSSGLTWGNTTTKYIFSIKNAIGIWLIGVAVSFLILLVCILISKINTKSADDNL